MEECLPLVVVYSSSEESDFSAQELNANNDETRGWQSARFCDYPQEVGLLVNRGARCQLQTVLPFSEHE